MPTNPITSVRKNLISNNPPPSQPPTLKFQQRNPDVDRRALPKSTIVHKNIPQLSGEQFSKLQSEWEFESKSTSKVQHSGMAEYFASSDKFVKEMMTIANEIRDKKIKVAVAYRAQQSAQSKVPTGFWGKVFSLNLVWQAHEAKNELKVLSTELGELETKKNEIPEKYAHKYDALFNKGKVTDHDFTDFVESFKLPELENPDDIERGIEEISALRKNLHKVRGFNNDRVSHFSDFLYDKQEKLREMRNVYSLASSEMTGHIAAFSADSPETDRQLSEVIDCSVP